MSYFRSNVDAMRGYVPGEQPSARARVIKLNTNENPYPPSPRVKQAIAAELGADGARLRLYSDPAAAALRRAAADALDFPMEGIVAGNGSDELLALLFRATVEPGQSVAFPYPTYTLYDTLAEAQGAVRRLVDFPEDFSLPRALWGEEAKLVLIASPAAPSGNRHATDSLRDLAQSLRGGLLVIDEAYADFAHGHALQLAKEIPNVVVLRTFSKGYSLAGMRLGLLFASQEVAEGLTKVKDSYNLDRLAIVAGAAALQDGEWMRANAQRVREQRARMIDGLRQLGLRVLPSEANFVLARLGSAQRARDAFAHLKTNGILVRYFSARLLDDALRISVGTPQEVDALLEQLGAFVESSGSS
jgi:histidinol-phosphate aminotransferase